MPKMPCEVIGDLVLTKSLKQTRGLTQNRVGEATSYNYADVLGNLAVARSAFGDTTQELGGKPSAESVTLEVDVLGNVVGRGNLLSLPGVDALGNVVGPSGESATWQNSASWSISSEDSRGDTQAREIYAKEDVIVQMLRERVEQYRRELHRLRSNAKA